jgi:hypothetical protein
MRWRRILGAAFVLLALLAACGGDSEPTAPAARVGDRPAATATLAATATSTPTVPAAQAATNTVVPSATSTPAAEPAPRPTFTPTTREHGWSDDTLWAVVPAAAGQPRLDWPWLVWVQDETPEVHSDRWSGVYAFNLDTGELVQVATGLRVSGLVGVDGGMVVWEESEGGSSTGVHELRGRDLTTGAEFTVGLVPSPLRSKPAFSGRWLVWVQWPSEYSRDEQGVMYAQDVRAMTEPAVVTSAHFGPFDVSGDLVAWVERWWDDPISSRLVVRNLVTGETVRDVTAEEGRTIYPLDLHGTTLVYVDSPVQGAGGQQRALIEDLSTGAARTLPLRVHSSEGGFPITTDGRFIVLMGYQTMGYDLERGAQFSLPVIRYDVDLEDGMLAWAIRRHELTGPTELHVAPAEEFASGQRSRYFPETDEWLALGFLRYWDANDGLPVFGFPLSRYYEQGRYVAGEMTEFAIQWTERQRFEWHPQHAGTVYEIELGRLGDELLLAQSRHWQDFPAADPSAPHYVAVTGHAIAPEFWAYWSRHGLDLGDPGVSYRESLALFGYPLSEPFTETNADGDTVLTQYFERAVFEWHPDNPETWRVLLRRLGAETLAARGWSE